MRLEKGGRTTFRSYIVKDLVRDIGLDDISLPRDVLYYRRTMEFNIKSALRKMRIEKSL